MSFDMSVYEDFHDTLDIPADEDTLRTSEAPVNEHLTKYEDLNKYEFEILEPEASDVEDLMSPSCRKRSITRRL